MIAPCYFIDVDTQNDFMSKEGLEPIPGASEIRHNLMLLTSHAVKKAHPIIAPVELYDKHLPGCLKLPLHCRCGSKGFEKITETRVKKMAIIPMSPARISYKEFLKKYHQIILEKYAYNAFNNPHFLKLLKAGRLKNCVVYGVGLDYGIESLVLRLMKEGFKVFMPVDAVKPINEENREMTLVELRKYGAEMWNTEFIIKNT